MFAVSRVILFVKNMEIMRAFYEDILGLKHVGSSIDNEDFVTLNAGAVLVELHKIPQKYSENIEISDPPVERSETPIKVVFEVDNFFESTNMLKSRGVKMRHYQSTEDVSYYDCVDPEGNIFQLSDR